MEELLDEIKSSITSKYPQAQVILFGSYARGDYSEDSDFGICVLLPEITENRICAVKGGNNEVSVRLVTHIHCYTLVLRYNLLCESG